MQFLEYYIDSGYFKVITTPYPDTEEEGIFHNKGQRFITGKNQSERPISVFLRSCQSSH